MNATAEKPTQTATERFYPQGKMKKLLIAFDVDGTLITNIGVEGKYRKFGVPFDDDLPNIHIVWLLQYLSKLTKNVRIIVWSHGGKEYAEAWGKRLGLDEYVWRYMEKDHTFGVDICFDDVQACDLADKNIIVRLK